MRGLIGTARVHKIGDAEMIRFSMATNYGYQGTDGGEIIETTWHNVVAFKSDKMRDFSGLVKGAEVRVVGRLRNQRYTDANGEERAITEIIASKIE